MSSLLRFPYFKCGGRRLTDTAAVLLWFTFMALARKDIVRLFQVPTNGHVRLKDYDPGWIGREQFRLLRKDELKTRAEAYMTTNLAELTAAQELLWANDTHAILVVLQAMDAAGKDGTIKHVMSGINPQGCQVFAFKKPSDEDLDHTFLWRYMRAMPERGRIGIFNRSYYEDVLVVRVHPEILQRQKLPSGSRGRRFWEDRYDDINALERHLVRNGTVVLKFFLHISRAEQRRRFLTRLSDPTKHWKFSEGDIDEREHWEAYQSAYEDALNHTSTKSAPWWVIPADHKWVARVLVAAIITRAIQDLGLRMPVVAVEREQKLEEARQRLIAGSAA
jgi:PPK2 family polyphosphate:nucleotide phosphotransferase